MLEEIKNLNDLNKGIHKQWIYGSKENYFIVCDYLQKINYSIQDINCELKNEQFKMKEIVYIIVLVDWIKSSFKKIKSLVIQDVIKKYKFSNEDRLKQAKDYFEAIRSYAVAHPLETTRHSNYGFDGDFICVDIRSKDIIQPFYSEKYCFSLDFNGLKKEIKNPKHEYYFYSYSSSMDSNKFFKLISFDIKDILNVARLYINALYELDVYLSKVKKKDYEVNSNEQNH